MHACFEGDVAALETLRANGCNLRQKFEWGLGLGLGFGVRVRLTLSLTLNRCNLRQKFEWVLQEEPLFSLVHAAAFNGQEKVLRY